MGLIYDWILFEGGIIVSWWLLVTLAGVAVFPLCTRLLSGLPDKGYVLSRTVGLLVVGYVFWILGVLGFLRNNPGSIAFAWFVVLVGSWTLYFALPGERINWREWWQENRAIIITAELLFVVLLFSWALVRASHPSLVATEKPMELAFISAVQRSEAFPPNDPWMSGYAISYYHFGYIIAASLSTLSGIDSPVGFNMMIALLFALTGLNTLGVVYNLIRSSAMRGIAAPRGAAVSVGLLGSVFVILLGNFQVPFIEVPYQSGIQNEAYYDFWDVQDRFDSPTRVPAEEDTVNVLGMPVLDPGQWSFWWWFRASRVINDRELTELTADGMVQGQSVGANVINEFPQFSFLLADVHPHVLALPFTVLAIGLALNILLTWRPPTRAETFFYGLAAGGLMFLNVWDGPIYVVVLIGAEGLRRVMVGRRLTVDDVWRLALFGGVLTALAFALYLPFFISFRSQASGIIPTLQYATSFTQFFIMFGPFILLLVPYLIVEALRGPMNWRAGATAAFSIFLLLAGVMILLTAVGSLVPEFRQTVLRFVEARGGFDNVIPLILARRVTDGLTTLLLLIALGIVVARLVPGPGKQQETTNPLNYSASTGFALFMVACAAGITLVPEFVYLRDNFGVRINTIFKFYYQGWVMFAIASAYAVYAMLLNWDFSNAITRAVQLPTLVIVLLLGLLYPSLGIHNRVYIESGRASNPQLQDFTLDGGPSLVSQDDYDAIMCLDQLVEGDDVVIAEAIGPAYRNQFGRVGVLTGMPIILGWEGHQRQWRGSTYNMVAGTRRDDVERLYNDTFWDSVTPIVERYDIDYIFYGTTERFGTGEVDPFNPAGEDKFIENLEVVCQHGESLFYRVTPRALEIAGADISD
ncbi:MAG: DUF2298 domain-containing protein [Chloroflexota bacterium]